MERVSRTYQFYFGIICAAALLVAVAGLLSPAWLAVVLPWTEIPPLHARFIGAIYLFGTVFMFNSMRARYLIEARWGVLLVAVFTGLLFLVSILNFSVFDLSRLPDQIWFASYIIYPLLGLWLFWKQPRILKDELPGPEVAPWAYNFLKAQGGLVVVLSLALLFAPAFMVTVWPWPVSPLLAQVYAGPLLAYGLSCILYGHARTWSGIRVLVPSLWAFTGAALTASILHRNLFSLAEASDILWFVFLAGFTAGNLALQAGLQKASRG
ncbi:MAG: hypothetical protein EPO32_12290 [Anaerolineae bacterium]|nr:MAG: hypothetical protein EPO32_12290 [Anaerolineae bacterium]